MKVAFTGPERHELQVTPDAEIPAGERFTVTVRYAGKPGAVGFGGERSWLASRHEVVTMNEPHMAAWWFPSNDHPLDKARFDIRITTGKKREVISNGRGVGRRVLALCEEAARAAGFTRLEMMATLAGEPLYRACGYEEIERVARMAPMGPPVPGVRMGKVLG